MKVRIGEFAFDHETRALHGAGRVRRLSASAATVLAHLVRAHGAVITRQDLLAAAFPAGAPDEALTDVILQIDQALGPTAKHYILAVARSGYRLNAEVEPYAAMRAAALEGEKRTTPSMLALWLSVAAVAVSATLIALGVFAPAPVGPVVKYDQVSSARP